MHDEIVSLFDAFFSSAIVAIVFFISADDTKFSPFSCRR
jgi:hypothetical protein